ncbi:DUF1801 domain-containing protein [Dysgonomonas sp. BGC7]|uniref:DUF1801 domain-containing protein n=1 Tax=Dysgonomonas sp. BGC7 TaxID=1658008 RepID=UPI00068003FC|nr:DUF1801 domain-containing protein [Dysgonomonas sp. BGC7]MBD8388938.1 DUF1801 domain-containing protein [Dysgonomonas sp. BGC7]
MQSLDDFYIEKEEPHRGCLLALRHLILSQDVNVSETIKYGMPCFCYKKKMFCYLWTDNKTNEPYILMVEGNLLNFPELEKGTRSRMKILRVDSNEDLPVELISEILNTALDLYRDNVISLKK